MIEPMKRLSKLMRLIIRFVIGNHPYKIAPGNQWFCRPDDPERRKYPRRQHRRQSPARASNPVTDDNRDAEPVRELNGAVRASDFSSDVRKWHRPPMAMVRRTDLQSSIRI